MEFKISAVILAVIILASAFILSNSAPIKDWVYSVVVPTTTPVFIPGFTPQPSPSLPAKTPFFPVTPTVTPTKTPTPTPTVKPSGTVTILDVPFSPQAPFGNWSDDRQQDGCEEASALMAVRWARGQTLTRQQALDEILAISEYELKTYGGYYDTSAQDTADRIFRGYFNYTDIEVRHDIGVQDIRAELTKGNAVVIPANGQKLNNPNFTSPGPLHHMLVIRGYDSGADEFITNDPGTRNGEAYRYSSAVIQDAIFDYATGHDEPILNIRTAMIVVRPTGNLQ